MTRALMVIVAGPAGSAKSRHFPVDSFGCDDFNIDLRAVALNGGSSQAIPRALRLRAQKECEVFVLDHIARGESFAVETALRSSAAIASPALRLAVHPQGALPSLRGCAHRRVHRRVGPHPRKG